MADERTYRHQQILDLIEEVEDTRLFEGVTTEEGYDMLWIKWHELVELIKKGAE